jgi:hypothetical protein
MACFSFWLGGAALASPQGGATLPTIFCQFLKRLINLKTKKLNKISVLP